MSQKDINKRLNGRLALAIICAMGAVFSICAVSTDLREINLKQVLLMMLAILALWAPISVIFGTLADLEEGEEEREAKRKEMQKQIDALWEASRGQAVSAKPYGPNRYSD